MIHTENFILVDPDKRIRGFYDGTDTSEMKSLLYDIRVLKKEYPIILYQLINFERNFYFYFKIILDSDPVKSAKIGENACIESIEIDKIPLKLIEMGCLPGNFITIIQKAPFDDPLYLKVDETHLAIRKKRQIHFC